VIDTWICYAIAAAIGAAIGGAVYANNVGPTLGQLPDWHGVDVANEYKATIQESATNAGIESIALAAGLAVQSQWCCGPGDFIEKFVQQDRQPSQGIAQLRPDEAGYFANGRYGPFNESASVSALAQKMKVSADKCSGCSTTDRFIALGLGHNSPVGNLSRNKDGSVDWNKYFANAGESTDPRLRARMAFGNSMVWDRFLLKVFINDLLELRDQGWTLPDDLNIPYMQCLANGSNSSCTP
jgi:hypothetical protein